MNEHEQISNPRKSAFLSRREFIHVGLAAVGAAWAGAWVQSKLFPEQSAVEEAVPVSFPLADLPVGSAKTFTYGGSPAILIRSPETIKAFSLVCTHLACTVQWQADQAEFYCPCHDGRFDQFGEVIAGPPPVPLEEFPVRVEGEQVVVGEII